MAVRWKQARDAARVIARTPHVSRYWPAPVGYLIGISSATCIALAAESMGTTTIHHANWMLILTFVVPLMVTSTIWGWGPGLVASLTTTLWWIHMLSFMGYGPSQLFSILPLVLILSVFSLIVGVSSVRQGLMQQKLRDAARFLEQQNTALYAANVSKEQFIELASHELRTPLTCVRMTLQLLRRQFPEADAVIRSDRRVAALHQYMGSMTAQVERLSQQLNDMMDSVHASTGRLVLYPDEINVGEIVDSVLRDARLIFDDRTFAYKLPSQAIYARGDPERLAQVLHNFISNACKFSSVDEEISLTVHRDAANVFVTVRDSGVGIPVDRQDAIWDRFYRIDQDQQAHSSHMGLGLGLYISREIMHQMGGDIGVRSASGAGSAFWFSLPIIEHAEMQRQSPVQLSVLRNEAN